MSVTVDWMDARYSVIHANFVAHWNWSELYEALNNAHTLMARSHQPITLMLDFIGSTKVSTTSALFTIADHIDAPDGIRKIIIVTDDMTLGEKLHGLLLDIYPNIERVMLTHSHEEAFERVRTTVEMVAAK